MHCPSDAHSVKEALHVLCGGSNLEIFHVFIYFETWPTEAVTPLSYIVKVPGSHLGRDSDYSGLVFVLSGTRRQMGAVLPP
jgi:hypothetical protein